MSENFHVEIHGIPDGKQLWDLQDTQKGLAKYLKDAYKVNWRVTAITDNAEIDLGHHRDFPYIRLYHDCDDSVMIQSAIKTIHTYSNMYRYGIQVIRMDYTPPDLGGHLP